MAMNEELKSLKKNATYRLASWQETCGMQMIYTMKYKADGTVDRFKARLVAK